MKTLLISVLALGWFTLFFTQNEPQQVQLNDVLVIQEPSGSDFKHILFPRKNFIIKRGGIANLKALKGSKVIVEDISYAGDGSTLITLRRLDGQRFFRAFPTVVARLEGALETGELRK